MTRIEFENLVYTEIATWLGRTPCKSCNTTVQFDADAGFLFAEVRSMGRAVSVCCEWCPYTE